jgi:hypothetical protein
MMMNAFVLGTVSNPPGWPFVVVLSIFTLALPLTFNQARRIWKGGDGAAGVSANYSTANPARRSWVRTKPPGAAAGAFLLLSGWCLIAADVPTHRLDVLIWMSRVSLCFTVLSSIAVVAIYLFNWPRELVSPHLRGEKGYLAERLLSRGASD